MSTNFGCLQNIAAKWARLNTETYPIRSDEQTQATNQVIPEVSVAAQVTVVVPTVNVVSCSARVHETNDTATLSYSVLRSRDGPCQLIVPVLAPAVVLPRYAAGHTITTRQFQCDHVADRG